MTAFVLGADNQSLLLGLLPENWPLTKGVSPESVRIIDASKEITGDLKTADHWLNFYGETELPQSLRLKYIDLYELLLVIRMRLPADTYERIARRLSALLDPTDWNEEDELPSLESFRAALSFLSSDRKLRLPVLSVNRQGNFVLAWRPDRDKLVSMIFEPNDQVSWLVFIPDEKATDGIEDAAGHCTHADRALDRVKDYGTSSWLYRPSFLTVINDWVSELKKLVGR